MRAAGTFLQFLETRTAPHLFKSIFVRLDCLGGLNPKSDILSGAHCVFTVNLLTKQGHAIQGGFFSAEENCCVPKTKPAVTSQTFKIFRHILIRTTTKVSILKNEQLTKESFIEGYHFGRFWVRLDQALLSSKHQF